MAKANYVELFREQSADLLKVETAYVDCGCVNLVTGRAAGMQMVINDSGDIMVGSGNIMVVMCDQAWSISGIVLAGMAGKTLHLDTVCSLFILCVCVCE
jgi:hypothetical protein